MMYEALVVHNITEGGGVEREVPLVNTGPWCLKVEEEDIAKRISGVASENKPRVYGIWKGKYNALAKRVLELTCYWAFNWSLHKH